MIDRHLLGDVGLAVLLVMPTLALSRPEAPVTNHQPKAAVPAVHQVAVAERKTLGGRVTLNG